jgi:hypothetical protein
MEYLCLEEIQTRSDEIGAAFDKLLTTRTLTARQGARQWLFLRACLNRLVSEGAPSEFDTISPVQAAQFKFEIEDKLRRYYLHPGSSVDFVFTIVHKTKFADYDEAARSYPDLAGYCLLVRDLATDRSAETPDGATLKSYLERVIAEANDAEFRAYAALPDIVTGDLERWFCADSPALREILTLLERHRQKRWIITNSYNPSTKRLINADVKKIGLGEATVNTMEYWYLRWWDDRQGSYAYSYRETNRQMYVLKQEAGEWKVFQNLRSLPRTSIPHRWNRRQK